MHEIILHIMASIMQYIFLFLSLFVYIYIEKNSTRIQVMMICNIKNLFSPLLAYNRAT